MVPLRRKRVVRLEKYGQKLFIKRQIPAVVWPPNAALLVPPRRKRALIREDYFLPIFRRPIFMHPGKIKTLAFLPLRQVWFLSGNKPIKSGFSQAPSYCFFTDLKVESGLNLLSALERVRNRCSNDEVVGLFRRASAPSGSSSIFQSAVFIPVGLNDSIHGTNRPLREAAYLTLRNALNR